MQNSGNSSLENVLISWFLQVHISTEQDALWSLLKDCYLLKESRILMWRRLAIPAPLLPLNCLDADSVQTFGDGELNNTHPAFLWAFRASHNWTALKDLIPDMRPHLETDPIARRYFSGTAKPKEHYLAMVEDFAVIFKELFCIAADDLASHLNQPLEQLGALFDEPISTGAVSRTNTVRPVPSSKKLSGNFSQEDLEKGDADDFFGKGQFLFVVRQLDRYEVERLAAHGYRFATIRQIADLASKSMQIPHEDISRHLDRMREYSIAESQLQPGTYLAAFLLRPKVNKGFDVLVPTNAKSQLPTVGLPFRKLTASQVKMLENFKDRRIADVLQDLLIKDGYTQDEQDLRWQFYWAINKLVELIGDSSFMTQAKFSAKMVEASCQPTRSSTLEEVEEKCTILSFRMITSLHDRSPNDQLAYIPLKFFNAQQQVLDRVACHSAFVREAREEFAHCRESLRGRVTQKRLTKSMEGGRSFSNSKTPPSQTRSLEMVRSDTRESHDSKSPMDPEQDCVEMRVRELGFMSSAESAEILPSKEDVDRRGAEGGGPRSRIGKRGHAPLTYVDELYMLFLAEQESNVG